MDALIWGSSLCACEMWPWMTMILLLLPPHLHLSRRYFLTTPRGSHCTARDCPREGVSCEIVLVAVAAHSEGCIALTGTHN
jgi:hypothetical protein